MLALAHANEVRLERAKLKQSLALDGRLYGPLRAAYALAAGEPADWLAGMPVYDLLDAIPQWGRGRILPLMAAAGVPESKLIGDATFRQRQALADALDKVVGDQLTAGDRRAFERELRAERAGR